MMNEGERLKGNEFVRKEEIDRKRRKKGTAWRAIR